MLKPRFTDIGDWERLGSRRVATNGIELRVVEHGDGPLIVLCHGFPELGFSWRHQVFALAGEGYRTMTPDMRGYGGSSRPPRIEDYDVPTVCADLVGLLDDVGAADAIFIGHDWGASVVWHLALAYPERVRAVAGLSVPAVARAPAPPLSILRRRHGDDFYMCWFQEPGVADQILARNARGAVFAEYTRAADWAALPDARSARPSWLSEPELQVYLDAFRMTGFGGGLNYYRNIDRNWAKTEHLDGRTIDRPSFFLTGSKDPVGAFMTPQKLARVLTDLREHVVVEGGGHWIQQERPEEVNAGLIRFLASLRT
ncbi:alpha/beta hydrolase [Actinomadura soli]|uniref:Alpha/beta hydrolase n=1 Tax=Actinomadura soli TaxID=2508997 RepID=A0A5C4JH99_9ACTN|nr:alpha/beta hydrolase [Actinomadura soli]TMR05693.1 alpha/beta hydrolase [Actinomadura soli]